jgi:hypothetical protein
VTSRRHRAVEVPNATFEALIFDWDGTVVPDRKANADAVRDRVEGLCAAGVHLFVVSGTDVGNVDGQLKARPPGPGHLYLCCNRGSEVFEVTRKGPVLVYRRSASIDEDRALDRAAEGTVQRLRTRGLETNVVSQRLNRRKIDLIPLPEWADPKKADINLLAEAVTARLAAAGIADLAEVVTLAGDAAQAGGLVDARITSDVKHVEIGLTDKSDSARFAASWLARRGITGALVLIGGDELGPIGGVPGSDSLMLVDALARATVVSVGIEPGGVASPVVRLGGAQPVSRSCSTPNSDAGPSAGCPRSTLIRPGWWRYPLRTPRNESPRRSVPSAMVSRPRGAPGTRTEPGRRRSSS